MASKPGRWAVMGSSVALAGATLAAREQAADPVRTGVLSDMSGPYSAVAEYGAVVGAILATEDVKQDNPDMHIEVIQDDFQTAQDGRCVVEQMKAKRSKGHWDYFKLRRVIPAAQAFRPMDPQACKMLRA